MKNISKYVRSLGNSSLDVRGSLWHGFPKFFITAIIYCGGSSAQAEDLAEALDAAYERSEVIANAVAEHEADLAGVTISRAEGLPSLNASLAVNETLSGSRTGSGRVTVRGDVSVPLYRGGTVRNEVQAARSQSDASYVGVRAAEMEIFAAVVTAYATVIRDRQILALSRNNLETLTTTMNATRSRFQARDLTRTDVSQAESRVALAQGEVQTAEADFVEASEEFRRLTGMEPTALAPLPPFQDLPPNADMAAVVAIEENPQVLAARAIAEARRYQTNAAKGEALPSVSAVANGRYGSGEQLLPTQQDESRFGATVGLSVNVPLFQGGRTSAGIRQAGIRENQALLNVRDLERTLEARARSQYANWRAASSVVVATEQAVAAARSALAGVRAESDVGARTILDILNAEQELRNAQVQLASAQRDSQVAAFSLLTTMGRTQAHHLGVRLDNAMSLEDEHGNVALLAPPTASGPIDRVTPNLASAAPQSVMIAEALPLEERLASPEPEETLLPAHQERVVAEELPEVQPRPTAESLAGQPDRFHPTDWVIQLAAHTQEAAARSHWNTIKPTISQIIGRTTPVVAAISSGERELFRLAIGPFLNFGAAETACHDLRMQNQNCIVRRFSTLGNPRWTGSDADSEGRR